MARMRKSVPLKKPFEGGPRGSVTEVILQEPGASDYFQLGEPRTWVKSGGGMALVDNDQAIRAYVERCIVEPDPLLALNNLHLIDARAVRDAVLDFFQDEAPTPSV